jgi:pyruvate formate lyase activating enzyme
MYLCTKQSHVSTMTGIIFDIKRFAVHDGPGIRTTVFLKGCPLCCGWCHNPEGIGLMPGQVSRELKLNGRSFSREEAIGYEISAEKLFAELEKERIFMDESGGGVTFSGGEPLQQHDFLVAMLRMCKNNGIHTAVDTSLYVGWEKIKDVAELADLFLIDLKLMDSAVHQHYTGVPNELILENIGKLTDSDVSVIIRIPMIPDVTTTAENTLQSILFLQSLNGKIQEVHLLPFHNTANEKYKRVGRENAFGQLKSLPKEAIKEIEQQYSNAGFTVKIGG